MPTKYSVLPTPSKHVLSLLGQSVVKSSSEVHSSWHWTLHLTWPSQCIIKNVLLAFPHHTTSETDLVILDDPRRDDFFPDHYQIPHPCVEGSFVCDLHKAYSWVYCTAPTRSLLHINLSVPTGVSGAQSGFKGVGNLWGGLRRLPQCNVEGGGGIINSCMEVDF